MLRLEGRVMAVVPVNWVVVLILVLEPRPLDTVADPAVQPVANGDTIAAASSLMVSQDAGIANPVSFLEELSSLNLSHLSTSCLPSEPGQFLTALDDLTLNLESSISTPTELPPFEPMSTPILLGVSWIRPPLLTL